MKNSGNFESTAEVRLAIEFDAADVGSRFGPDWLHLHHALSKLNCRLGAVTTSEIAKALGWSMGKTQGELAAGVRNGLIERGGPRWRCKWNAIPLQEEPPAPWFVGQITPTVLAERSEP